MCKTDIPHLTFNASDPLSPEMDVMMRLLFRTVVTAVIAVLLLGLCSVASEAKTRVPRVSGLTYGGQNWDQGKIRVKWRAVPGARYQMRVAASPGLLGRARVVRTRHAVAWTRSLSRTRPYYVQVRALKRRKVGAWSSSSRYHFVRPASQPIESPVETPTVPATPVPNTRTVYGMNVSPGTSWTNGVRESAADQVNRVVGTYGSLGVAKIFYSGNLPATFNHNYEGLVPGKTVAVCFKPNQSALASGQLDASIRGYINSIPAGWKVMLVNWQEPDDEIWKDKVFTPAQHRAATEQLIDVARANPAYAAGKVEVWDVFMGFSIDVGRWADSAASPRLDGIGWDYYWNKPTTNWGADPAVMLKRMADVNRRIGIKKWGLFETGDNPHANDADGTGRAAFWNRVYVDAANAGYSYVMYFNAIGTTGDHRIIPSTGFGAPVMRVLRTHMTR